MAMQKSYTDNYGNAAHSSAYHRVECVELDSKNQTAKIRVSIYRTASDVGSKDPLEIRHYRVTEDYATYFAVSVLDTVSENLQKSAYDYLTTEESDYSTGVTDV